MDEELDSSTAAAWTRFQAQLADHLAEMAEDDLLLLEAESSTEDDEGAAPYVQFSAWGDGQLRCEAVSNHYLADRHRLRRVAQLRLWDLGFSTPTCDPGDLADSGSANFWVDATTGDADRLAVMAVRALRDVYGVTHPAFLTGHPIVDEGKPPSESLVTTGGVIAEYPSDGFDHLQRLVDEALTPWLGHPPNHDDDGDIPIDCGDVVVFARVLADKPVVRLFACVASDVEDLSRAASEVAILNRDTLFFKFLVLGDAIVMHADILAWPFAAAHVRDMVEHMCRSVGQIHDDLAARLSTSTDEVQDDESLHPAMRTLLELEAAEPESVDPRLAAAICEHDRDLVLRLLTWSQQQHSSEMTALLRAALRVIVERQAARYDKSRRHAGGRLSPRGSRRVPDPTLEEVDPEMWS